jgi:outer membrane protein assembly factor BamB
MEEVIRRRPREENPGLSKGRAAAVPGWNTWIGENPGGTCAALAVIGDVVIATALPGGITAFEVDTGRPRWRVDPDRGLTGSLPLTRTIMPGNLAASKFYGQNPSRAAFRF